MTLQQLEHLFTTFFHKKVEIRVHPIHTLETKKSVSGICPHMTGDKETGDKDVLLISSLNSEV